MDKKTKTLQVKTTLAASPYLQVLLGKDKGKKFELDQSMINIGRNAESHVTLSSDAISRNHASLSLHKNHWLIRDNQSKNGVLVNGDRVDEKILVSGDLIQIGDHIFRFVVPRPSQKRGSLRRHEAALHSSFRIQPPSSSISRFLFIGTILAVLSYLLVTQIHSPNQKETNPGLLTVLKITPSENMTSGFGADVLKDIARQAPSPATADKPVVSANNRSISQLLSNTTHSQITPNPKPAPKSTPRSIDEKHQKSLSIYLREGRDYLAEGDMSSAAIAFRFALNLDPANKAAIDGLEMTGHAVDKTPKPVDKHNLVATLMMEAQTALLKGKYQQAIDKAEEARGVEVNGETKYLNEAKQIIDKAHMAQKEEFEPFMEQAKILYQNKAYQASRELCREMLRRDDSYKPARECMERADQEIGLMNNQGKAE